MFLILRYRMVFLRYADAHRSCGICLNLQHIDLSTTSFDAACGIMKGHINNILQELNSKKEIETFTFGKTYTTSKKYFYFPVNNTNSWNLSGIRSAWKRFKALGFHNLVVVSVVDEHQIPLYNMLWRNNDTEDFTVALKQNLIHFYKITKKDRRLGNVNCREGARKDNSYRGVLYMAIRYTEPEDDDDCQWLFYWVIALIFWPLYVVYILYKLQQPSRRRKKR